MGRFMHAFKIFIRAIRDRHFAESLDKLEQGGFYEPSQILALFQRNGRFIDFIKEDIASFSDAQIGAVARSVHQGCDKVLKEYLILEPVLGEPEGKEITVEKGFDPSKVRLVGNVHGDPPFKGSLTHHGWKIGEVKIPPLPEGHDPSVIDPAEVEIR
jgi:hypothetical protein